MDSPVDLDVWGFYKWNTKSLSFNEGSWLDYSNSYPSRNRKLISAWHMCNKAAT